MQKNTENISQMYVAVFILMLAILIYFSVKIFQLLSFLNSISDNEFSTESSWISGFYILLLGSYVEVFSAMWIFHCCIKGKKPLNKLYMDDFCPKELKTLKKK